MYDFPTFHILTWYINNLLFVKGVQTVFDFSDRLIFSFQIGPYGFFGLQSCTLLSAVFGSLFVSSSLG